MEVFLVLDIERRVRLAAEELLKAFTPLTDLLDYETEELICFRRDNSDEARYPKVWLQCVGFAEFGRHTGQYMGVLQLAAQTYGPDDKSGTGCERLVGALRGWAQHTDRVAQINATDAATANDSLLTVNYFVCDGTPFDQSQGRINTQVVSCSIHVRPSR